MNREKVERNQQVVDMWFAEKEISQKEIGRRFGIAQRTVSDIINKYWRNNKGG